MAIQKTNNLQDKTLQEDRQLETLSDKKILNNIRIYSRDGPLVEEKSVSSFRKYLPQFLANFSINLMMADNGLALSFPTLVIGYLLKANTATDHSTDGFLQLNIFKPIEFDKFQSSLYSSLQFLSIPVGCILGGCIIDRFGRKKIMFLARLPMFASWLISFFSQNIGMLYLANILSGLSIGCGEPAIATYQGEVTEPAIRGTLINFAILWLAVFLLGPFVLHLAVPSWRWIALMFSVVSVIAGIVALLVPESPTWLLSKGNVTQAEEALKKLRGGATKRDIDEEMQEIVSYHYSSTSSCNRLTSQATSSDKLFSRKSLKDKWDYFKSDKMRRPFLLSCVMFTLVYTTGVSTMRPFINPVLKMIHFHGNWTTIGLTITFAGVVGNILAFLTIGFTGKRILVLSALSVNGLCALFVALSVIKNWSVYSALIAIHIMCFVNGYGIIPIPWILQSEIYPFRGRGFAAGLAAGLSYFMAFIAALSFLPLTSVISIQIVFLIFFFFSLFGFIFMYFKLPETEGRSLQQIEQFFSKKKNIET